MDDLGKLQDQVVEVKEGEEGTWKKLGGLPERRGYRWSQEFWT